jgi:hypothetical protein
VYESFDVSFNQIRLVYSGSNRSVPKILYQLICSHKPIHLISYWKKLTTSCVDLFNILMNALITFGIAAFDHLKIRQEVTTRNDQIHKVADD